MNQPRGFGGIELGDTKRGGNPFNARGGAGADALRQRTRDLSSLGNTSLRQQDSELLTTCAEELIGLAQPLLDSLSQRDQHPTVGLVAIAVVDALELVDVED
jgi:hypothetical protein